MITNAEVIQVLSVTWTIMVYFIKCIPGIAILYAIGYVITVKNRDKRRQLIDDCCKLVNEVFLNDDQIAVELRGATYKVDREKLLACLKPNFKHLAELSNRLKALQ
jgi:hypothetical protein